jgi:hypothetical protein
MNNGYVSREYPELMLKDGNDPNPNPNPNPNPDGGAKKVDLTQDELNALIDRRFGKISSKHEDEKKTLTDEIATLRAELEAAKAGKGGKEGKDGEEDEGTRKRYKDILTTEENKRKAEETKRQSAERERDEARKNEMAIRKEVAMHRGMQKANFVDQNDVVALTQNMIQFSEEHNRFVVMDQDGKPRENAKLEPLTLDEFYADFAAKRPYLVNADMVSGAGSSENNGRAGSQLGIVRTKADLKSWKDKSDYIDKFGREAYEKLPLKP